MAVLAKVKTVSLADSVEQNLLDYIRKEGLKTGDLIPKEEELSAALGVSRNIIREGIARLKAIGIIEARRKRGSVVCKPDLFSVMPKLMEANLFTKRDCADFMGLRIALELGMCEAVYLSRTPEKIAELRKCASNFQTADKRQEQKFHMMLLSFAENRMAQQLQNMLAYLFSKITFHGKNAPYSKLSPTPTHKDICDVLENGTLEDFWNVMRHHFEPYRKIFLDEPETEKNS